VQDSSKIIFVLTVLYYIMLKKKRNNSMRIATESKDEIQTIATPQKQLKVSSSVEVPNAVEAIFLSNDVLMEIFLHLSTSIFCCFIKLDPPFIWEVKTVCKQWNEVISSEDLWKRKCFILWPTLSSVAPKFVAHEESTSPDSSPSSSPEPPKVVVLKRRQLGLVLYSWEDLFRYCYRRDTVVKPKSN